MNPKKQATKPEGYYDYTVYPLEGVLCLNSRGQLPKFNIKLLKNKALMVNG